MNADTLAERPVTALRGVGAALAESLARLDLRTVQDVLFHLPLRYEDRTRVVPIGAVRNGERAVIEGEIQLAEIVFRRRRTLLVRVADGTGSVTLRFFHFSGAQQAQLVRGQRLRCFGEFRMGPAGPEIVHPEYRRVGPATEEAQPESLTPVYPATEGVQQGRLRVLTDLALALLSQGAVRDLVPPGVLDAFEPAAAGSRAALRTSSTAGCGPAGARSRHASGAAAARIRGVAGAPTQLAVAAAGDGS